MIKKLILILALVASCCSAPQDASVEEVVESSQHEDAVAVDQETSESKTQSTAIERPSEPPSIPGLDAKKAVFHQRHLLSDGSYVGIYGYYDSREVFHVLNYVTDESGMRVVGDHTPFHLLNLGVAGPLVSSATAATSSSQMSGSASSSGHNGPEHFQNEEKREVMEESVSAKAPQETLITGDADNLLRDEHSIVRTHALPPPPGFHGLNSSPSRYYHGYHYGNQHNNVGYRETPFQHNVNKRIPYPYENPLYPLLYQDRNRLHGGTRGGEEEINDTSGLSAADGISEVPSNPGKGVRPVAAALPNHHHQPIGVNKHAQAGYIDHGYAGGNYIHRGDYYGNRQPAQNNYGYYPNGYYGNQGAYYTGAQQNYHGASAGHGGLYGQYGTYGTQQSSYVQPGQNYYYRYQYTYPHGYQNA